MLVSWIEDDPQATELLELTGKPDWGAYVVRLDASGMATQGAIQVPIDPTVGKGIVSGVAVDCAAQGSVTAASCRLVLAYSDREGIALLGAVAGPTDVTPARALWSFYGAPTQEVSPAIAGPAAYLCEDGLEKDDGRVRRLSISW
jgi:hypothetical protein